MGRQHAGSLSSGPCARHITGRNQSQQFVSTQHVESHTVHDNCSYPVSVFDGRAVGGLRSRKGEQGTW
jgi:hypothetical protein